MNRQSEFFFFTMQFYQTCRIPDETKKILGPKIYPPNFQALKFFREGLNDMARQKMKSFVYGWFFIHRTIC